MSLARRAVAFEQLPNDVQFMVLRWMTVSTMTILACTSRSSHRTVRHGAGVLFEEVASIASSSWHSFLVGAGTVYKLARLASRHPVVTWEFRKWCSEAVESVIGGPYARPYAQINELALELLYFVLVGTYNARQWTLPHILTWSESRNLINPDIGSSLIRDSVTLMLHSYGHELKIEHVEHAIELQCRTVKKSKALYESHLDDNEDLDPNFEPDAE